ncbi:ParB/RepB/Spo0J family partition protein [Antricoccus suffuscus]|uniref:ParB/RepB/Spo0J family partition protein n=1 Tax=Antricoccus suffuscus TaxID=1629062 RepID=A0A2T1A245_9ACTN|nr:ParB/RepB/Spo0J family partition protein [Antricoccus suffuscus]PRZ42680.1 ParB/RepB/Spo0J family partition protein [Antricoccus suffuscus]
MSDEKSPQPSPSTARKGGLGRGLGALIPSNPLGNSAGRGHFWSALDNPPKGEPGDTELVKSTAIPALTKPVTTPEKASGADTEGDDNAPVDNVSAEPAGHDRDNEVVHNGERAVDNDVSRETDESSGDSVATEVDSTGTESVADGELIEPPDNVEGVNAPEGANAFEGVAVLLELDPAVVLPNPKNPRTVFDEENLSELSASIKDFGLLQPIVVRRGPDDGTYELIMGERRLRAAKLAGVETIPAIVRQTEDDAMLRDALLENIHRVQLNPLEEAAAYQQLIEEFDVTHDELAHRIKRSRSQISNMLRLMKLPPRVQQRVAAGVLSYGHARAILGLEDPDKQEALATRVVAEGMSVRATEEAVSLASEDQPKKRATRRKQITAPALRTLAENLSDHFDTRAIVQLGRSKGKIVVEFGSIDDLERIVALMAPKLATPRENAAADTDTAE